MLGHVLRSEKLLNGCSDEMVDRKKPGKKPGKKPAERFERSLVFLVTRFCL